MAREEYIKNRAKIINQARPYTATVKQRGPFYNSKTTFGTDRYFKEVSFKDYLTPHLRNPSNESNLQFMVRLRLLIHRTRATIRR